MKMRHLCAMLLLCVAAVCQPAQAGLPPTATETSHQHRVGYVNPESLLVYAKTLLGVPYRYGMSNPKRGFDCSGFVGHVFSHFGIKLPRSSADYPRIGQTIPLNEAQPGDIMIFTRPSTAKKGRAGHVGIVCDTKHGLKFIHASSGRVKRVIISPFAGTYVKRFIKVIRLPQLCMPEDHVQKISPAEK